MPSHKVIELVTRYEDLISTLSHLLNNKSRSTALTTHLYEQRYELIGEIENLRNDLELSNIF